MPALRFNEGRSCDAVLRVLEARAGSRREGLKFPEQEGHRYPVEVACNISGHLYALEHTGIEPFAGHMQLSAQAQLRVDPTIDRVGQQLPGREEFELQAPVAGVMAVQPRDFPAVHEALAEWIVRTAPTLPVAPLGRYLRTPSTSIPGVPFPVRLHRMEPVGLPNRLSVKLILEGDLEQQRFQRVRKALTTKCAKLAGWKAEEGARSVLVLEQADIQLTNPHLVTEVLLAAEGEIPDRADEVYLVATCLEPWPVFPLRVDATSYFDLQLPESRRMEFDPRTLRDITGRGPA